MTRATPMHYDVVVAGAGPAGSKAALDLAQAGVRVLLLEEHREIGTPLHCSGLVTRRTLETAGIGEWIIRHTITGSLVYSGDGLKLRLGNHQERALVIDRIGFDRWLAYQAQEQGVDLWLGTRLETIDYQANGVALGLHTQAGRKQVTAALLIGADGAGSRVARFLGKHSNSDRICALGGVIALPHQADCSYVRVFVGEDIAPEWFGWMIPTGDGRARIGIGAGVSSGLSQKRLLQQLFERFPQEFQGARILELTGGTIPLYQPIAPYGERIMLVGDAARHVKPVSGGGIRTALLGAVQSAQTAVEALGAGDFSAQFLQRYADRCRQVMGEEFDQAHQFRKLALRLSESQRQRLLRLLAHPVFTRMLNSNGDIDFPGRMFSAFLRQKNLRSLLFSLLPPTAAVLLDDAFAPLE